MMKDDAMLNTAPTSKADYIRLLDYAIEALDELHTQLNEVDAILLSNYKVAA